jgi:hypothetical protein
MPLSLQYLFATQNTGFGPLLRSLQKQTMPLKNSSFEVAQLAISHLWRKGEVYGGRTCD